MTPCMITTISRDADPVNCRMPDEMSRKAKISADDGDPDRVVATEQGHGDPGEAEALDGVRPGTKPLSDDLGHPHETGDGAGQDHRDHDHPLRRNAADLGGERVDAAGPQVEPEPGAVDQHVVADADEDRDSSTPVSSWPWPMSRVKISTTQLRLGMQARLRGSASVPESGRLPPWIAPATCQTRRRSGRRWRWR